MNYNIDFIKIAVHLLPPILRGGFMVALVRAFLIPLRYIHGRFLEYKNGVDDRLNTTANVQYIQKRLNDTFYLTANQIYLEQGDAGSFSVFYFENERQKANYMFRKPEGKPYCIPFASEVSYKDSFIVHVPTFLCTSLEAAEDEYGGRNLSLIRRILDIYKPAGRTYQVKLYDYYE